MADTETSIVSKADEESNRPPNPLVSLFSKFTQAFNFPFPSSPPSAKKDVVDGDTKSKGAGVAAGRRGEVVEEPKPVTVRFPDGRTTTVAPLKLEAEEAEQDTNPVVLWQVYAIGGFFIMRWFLARWKERRAKNKKSDEDTPPPPPPPATTDE